MYLNNTAGRQSRFAADRTVTLYLRILLPLSVAGILLAAVLRVLRPNGPLSYEEAGFLVLYVAWVLAESKITTRGPSTPSSERLTLLLYSGARSATALTGAWVPAIWNDDVSPWFFAGTLLVFVTGACLRFWAIRSLGDFYSHHVAVHPEHTVVDQGPYRVLRHPAYTGMLLANLGYVFFFLSPASALCFVVLIGVIVFRVLVEERTMKTVPGYLGFAQSRQRLIPGVW